MFCDKAMDFIFKSIYGSLLNNDCIYLYIVFIL